ncbi:uncharacterized protein LOC135702550 [Ochlerotatus camptorhynchus]|uniref:uncharacterized protein LOC135702550 n=1 Tax=Ochlerotatus camptorhynchus TaxID=644619 RepID=UPI0031E41A4E
MLWNSKFRLVGLLLLAVVLASEDGGKEEGRFMFHGKPFLVVPKTSPTRHQFVSGIGIPLGTPNSVTTGWVLKAYYFLPTTVAQLQPVNIEGWNDTRRSFEKREAVTTTSLDHYEAYEAKDVRIDTESLPTGDQASDEDDYFEDGDDNYWLDEDEEKIYREMNKMNLPISMDPPTEGYNADSSRWTTYKALEKMGEVYGSGGRECVLRSICEAASAQFTHTGGVFAELLHIMFTPTTTEDPLSEHSDNEYYRAEELGREGAPCHVVFHECRNSILDVFTGVHDPVTNTLTVAHDKVMRSFMK